MVLKDEIIRCHLSERPREATSSLSRSVLARTSQVLILATLFQPSNGFPVMR